MKTAFTQKLEIVFRCLLILCLVYTGEWGPSFFVDKMTTDLLLNVCKYILLPQQRFVSSALIRACVLDKVWRLCKWDVCDICDNLPRWFVKL